MNLPLQLRLSTPPASTEEEGEYDERQGESEEYGGQAPANVALAFCCVSRSNVHGLFLHVG